MIIVVDAYNVLKQIRHKKISQDDRVRFVKQLNAYVQLKRHQALAVFDAGPYEQPSHEHVGDVRVVYAGQLSTADSWIKHYLTSNRGRDLLLVSSDRELVECANACALPSLGSLDFYHIMQHALAVSSAPATKVGEQHAVKTSSHKNQDLDALMQEAAQHIKRDYEEKPRESRTRKSPAQVVPKKERALLKKIKKL